MEPWGVFARESAGAAEGDEAGHVAHEEGEAALEDLGGAIEAVARVGPDRLGDGGGGVEAAGELRGGGVAGGFYGNGGVERGETLRGRFSEVDGG